MALKIGQEDYKILEFLIKRVPIYRCPEAQGRCHVYLLDLHLSRLPVQAFIDDTFYMYKRPLPAIPPAAHLPWFANSWLGKHAISKMLTNMCNEAGIEKKTNHCLHTVRVTGATSLFEKQVPEKIVKERTGHRSLTALRMYERTSPTQHKAVSNILGGNLMKKCAKDHLLRKLEYLQLDNKKTKYP